MTDTKTKADAQDSVRDRAAHSYASSKRSAKQAARRAAGELDANPLAILAGGIAVGALAGALLPRSAREKELLAPVGQRLGETARQALAAAKDAGRQELDAAGLSTGAVKDRGRDVIDGLGKALSSAGTAAARSARGGDSAAS